MNLITTIVKYFVVIILGFIVFYIDDLAFIDSIFTKLILLTICLCKCAYFVFVSYRKILETNEKDVPYYSFLLFMAVNVSLMIISFAVDNYCLYKMDESSFVGIHARYSEIETMFEFLYYSLLGFTNFGFGVLMPTALTGKSLIMLEIVISFVTIIFILSDFISLKDSIKKEN